MKVNRGKQFEDRFEQDWNESVTNPTIIRLKDNTSKYFGASRNECDFIGFASRNLYLIETKTCYEDRFDFSKLPQYDKLIDYVGREHVYPVVIIWFIDHDTVLWVPIPTVTRILNEGHKSLNINKWKNYEDIIEVPSIKLRVFMQSNYQAIIDMQKE